MDPESVDLGSEVGEGRGDGVREVDGIVPVQLALATGEGEQRFDQASMVGVGSKHLFSGGTPGGGRGVWIVERDLQQRALGGEGGAQLM